MRVWIINPFDNLPSEGYRPQRYWLMARAFAVAGHDVTYWTSDFSHASKKRRNIVKKVEDGFVVKMVPTLAYPTNICIKRVLSHRRLAQDWFASAGRATIAPDIVIASMPPLGLCDAARRFAAGCGAMFIADIQDAWPETFERVMPKFFLSVLGLYRKAKRVYREADGISAVAMRYVELAQKYGSDAPMMEFGHCIDMTTRAVNPSVDDSTLRLAYVGNMSLSYDLETVIRAVADMEGVSLGIAGNGPDKERLERLANDAGNIKFNGYLGDEDLAKLLASCNVGLVPMFPDSCVGVPGKLADYAAARLKVIGSLEGETAELVDRYNVGGHYKSGDVESLRQAIMDIRGKIPTPNPPGFAAHFDAVTVMDAYVKWVQGLCRCRQDWGSTHGPHGVSL